VWPLLPNLVLVDVLWSPLRFRYRLLGTRLDAMIGKSLVGQWLDQAYAREPGGGAIIGQYVRVAQTREPAWRRGPPHVGSDARCHEIEALRLPFASDGNTVDMILGLTMYFDAEQKPVISFSRFGNSSAEFTPAPRPKR
jgi:hypothetical protein